MNTFTKRIITGIVAGLVFFGIFAYLPPIIFSLLLLLLLMTILVTEWPRLAQATWWLWVLTPVYPVLPFLGMIWLNHAGPDGRWLLVQLLIAVFSFDTGAYLVGSLIGRHKLLPQVSPGKTWEGFFGGVLCMSGVLVVTSTQQYRLPTVFVQALLIGIVGTIGDLFESWLKRRAYIKDSGVILPGHGGLLDRFDGVMMVMIGIIVMRLVSPCKTLIF